MALRQCAGPAPPTRAGSLGSGSPSGAGDVVQLGGRRPSERGVSFTVPGTGSQRERLAVLEVLRAGGLDGWCRPDNRRAPVRAGQVPRPPPPTPDTPLELLRRQTPAPLEVAALWRAPAASMAVMAMETPSSAMRMQTLTSCPSSIGCAAARVCSSALTVEPRDQLPVLERRRPLTEVELELVRLVDAGQECHLGAPMGPVLAGNAPNRVWRSARAAAGDRAQPGLQRQVQELADPAGVGDRGAHCAGNF